MPAFAPKLSQEQRAAIVAYAMQPGSSARAAWRAARAGEIEGGAVDIGYTRVAELVSQEREHRNGLKARKIARKGAAVAVDEMVGELLDICDRERRQLKNRPTNQPVDTERVRRLARALREIRLAAAPVNGAGPSAKGTKTPETVQGTERTLLEQLARGEADADPSIEEQENAEGTGDVEPTGMEEGPAQEEPNTGEAAQAVRESASDVEPLAASGV